MKQCPKCRNIYSDDNLFCLEDGTPLTDNSDQDDTPTFAFTSSDTPTQVLQQVPVKNPLPPAGAPKWLYVLVGAMAMTIAALGIAFYYSRSGNDEQKTAKKTDEPANTRNSGTNVNAANMNPTPNQNAMPRPSVSAPPANPALSPGGRWTGDWNSTGKTTSTSFTAEMQLTEDGTGKINGQIVWTLRSTTNPKKIGKEGMSATEYVQGVFDPNTRLLSLKGYRKEDPNNLVILDKYSLSLAEDNRNMRGKSIGGQFVLRR